MLRQLTADGLLEDTFIFYFGDHGGVLPRSKGYAYESGLHVPLVVRIPANFRHLVDHNRNIRLGGFVSFIDFGPTVLHLAGLEIDSRLDGIPFLGPNVSAKDLASRDETFGHADRFDEKYDHVRTLRKGRYSYIRNYQGFYPDGLQNNYRYRMLAFQEWRSLHKNGSLNAAQKQFFLPRPAEQLFDIHSDPHQVKDLSADPAHRKILLDLRNRLRKKVVAINDLSLYPESHQVHNMLDDPIGFGVAHRDEIAHLHAISALALAPPTTALGKLKAHLLSKNPWHRYWACQAVSLIGPAAKPISGEIAACLTDPHPMVRLRAAECLAVLKTTSPDPLPVLYDVLNTVPSETEALLVLNTFVYLRDHRGLAIDTRRLQPRFSGGQVARRLDYFRRPAVR